MSEKQEKIAQVLRDSAQLVRSVSTERDDLAIKLAASEAQNAVYERRIECEKVAASMHSKGIRTDEEFSAVVDDLEKSAAAGKLEAIEQAVDMVAPDMSFKTASITDAPAASGSEFERFLLGDVG